MYVADNCYYDEEPPSLDSIPADVVAEIVAGEEMYSGQEVVVVDKQPVDCVENVPGGSNQASRDAGNGFELLDAPETTNS